jgi:curli biogenesis system outer membrane secretion channel CsgG
MSASTFLKILGPASAILLAACASQPATTHAAPMSVAEAAPKERPFCLRSTGTRIAVPEGKCVAAGGRVITREELERSGGINLSGALNRVAPF